MFKVFVEYPSFDEEFEVARRTTAIQSDNIQPVLSGEEILELQRTGPRGAGDGPRDPLRVVAGPPDASGLPGHARLCRRDAQPGGRVRGPSSS
jgi:hypothetical protein